MSGWSLLLLLTSPMWQEGRPVRADGMGDKYEQFAGWHHGYLNQMAAAAAAAAASAGRNATLLPEARPGSTHLQDRLILTGCGPQFLISRVAYPPFVHFAHSVDFSPSLFFGFSNPDAVNEHAPRSPTSHAVKFFYKKTV